MTTFFCICGILRGQLMNRVYITTGLVVPSNGHLHANKMKPALNVYKILPPGLTVYFIYCSAKTNFKIARFVFATGLTCVQSMAEASRPGQKVLKTELNKVNFVQMHHRTLDSGVFGNHREKLLLDLHTRVGINSSIFPDVICESFVSLCAN